MKNSPISQAADFVANRLKTEPRFSEDPWKFRNEFALPEIFFENLKAKLTVLGIKADCPWPGGFFRETKQPAGDIVFMCVPDWLR